MIPAKLPAKFIKKPEIHLENLKAGESGWVDWLEMAVYSEYNCFINPKARVHNQTISTIRATRTENGFEVLIPAGIAPLSWELGKCNPQKNPEHKRYVPVVKIEEEKEEEEEVPGAGSPDPAREPVMSNISDRMKMKYAAIPGAATALAGPRSATRHWRRRSGSEGAPSIVRFSIHPPPPSTPYPEYNLWPHPYRPDEPPGPAQHSPPGRGFAVTSSFLLL